MIRAAGPRGALRGAYERIARIYERANVAVTLGFVDRWRREAVALMYALARRPPLRVLDAGAGPGNMALHLRRPAYVVALDATPEMLRANRVAGDRVAGVLEMLPFRDRSFDAVIAGYSLHAVSDMERAVEEFSRVAEYQAVVSIGRPESRVIGRLVELYARYAMPVLACALAPGRGCREYAKIALAVSSSPPNSRLRVLVSSRAELLAFRERALGAIYIYVARRR
jgi:demethylmenaquinone methyltransferase/2-methoxy-6-polyprenyl-1,4-benzoquinol methylase